MHKISKKDYSWGKEANWSLANISRYLEAKVTHLVFAGKSLVGTVTLLNSDESIWGKRANNALYLHRLAIASNFRGNGIGRKIINWCEEQARLAGCKYLRLDCDNNNQDLCVYYERNGFRKTHISKPVGDDNYKAALYEKQVP